MCENNNVGMMTDVDLAWEILMASKTNVRVAVTVSPAVRVAIGEAFGLTTGEDVMGKLTTALRTLGADVVVDGAIAEDALVYELAREVKDRLENGGALPVVYSKKREWAMAALENPALAPHIVTVRPSFQALAVELKKMFLGDGKRTYVIAIVSCLGKKAAVENVGLRVGDLPAADLALTTVELADMLIAAGLDLKYIPASGCDEPFGTSSGCGYIADIGGGIAEGVLRSLATDQSEDGIRRIEYSGVRGYKDVRIGYSDYNAAVVSGVANADEMAKKIVGGECDCVFVEVVGNPLGCAAAGRGQPDCNENTKRLRAYTLQCLDKKSETRVADAAEDTIALYQQFIEARGNDGFAEVDASLAPFDEEVVLEEPVVEEVVAEEPIFEEPVVKKVVVEEPIFDEVDLAPKTFDPNYRRMSKRERRKMKRMKN